VFLLIIGFIASWRYFGQMNPYDSLMPGIAQGAQIPIELSDVEVKTHDRYHLTAELHAASLTISANQGSVRSIVGNGLTDGVFYKDGSPALHFSAPFIQYSAPQFFAPSNVTISGGVDVWSQSPSSLSPIALRISTDTVKWNQTTSEAVCPGPVRFTAHDLGSGTASNLQLNSRNHDINFGQVSGVIQTRLTDLSEPPQSAKPIGNTGTSASAADTDDNQLKYNANGHGHWSGDESVLTVTGPVTFDQGEAEVKMEGAVYTKGTDTAVSSAPITITDTDTTVTGDSGSIDFSTHVAILHGDIKMLILPKPGDKVKEDEAKKPTTILCDQINYNYRVKKAHTIGSVIIKQPTTGRTVTADEGLYDASLKVVDLQGNVIGKSTDGKVVRTPHARLSVDPNDEWLDADGPISGVIPVQDQDNPLSASTDTHQKQKSGPDIQPQNTTDGKK
jgi:hypothetical protein